MSRNRPWTAAERQLMRELYPHIPSADLAALLGRGIKSVY